MGQAPVGAGDYDGVEGHVRRAVAQHQILKPGGDFLFRHAGADFLQNVLQGPLGNALGGFHGLELRRVLGLPELHNGFRGGNQLAGGVALLVQGLFQPPEGLDGHGRVLEAQAADAL